ncbi:MAG TPA: tetratricopeptide repeat protein [Mycobacteriales bacterium]|jgi:serine/threonine-protein kinase PknG|nr:tetratricopeptide repeat protein [Mycobacteriales bacterium]
MRACNRPSCSGTIEETGFCDTCFRRPLPLSRRTEAMAVEVVVPSGEPSTTRAGGIWVSGDLLSLPFFDLPDAASLVLPHSEVPEKDRFCSTCQTPVGRGYAGQPAFTEGHCGRCDTRFSFSLKLHEGDLVADRYEVVGPLAHGGFGWVYLARARHLDDIYVVLKGLIDTRDENARRFAARERLVLTRLDHSKVVRIYDFVRHPDPVSGDPTDYIVMEYVGGPSLDDLLRDPKWRDQHGPLRVWHVIAYTQEILDALDYLHGRELLYCDMKPANAIRGADRLKVIDLGAVRGVGDRESTSVGTEKYRVPRTEIEKHGWSVRSDLHTVGITLRELFDATEDRLLVGGPLSFGIRSLEYVIERAIGEYERRFVAAAEMSQQLRGVLREILALRGDVLEPSPSVLFDGAVELLDDGLGAVPPLARWTDEAEPGSGDVLPDGRPSARAVAVGLPAPRVRADDRGADYLATVGASSPRALVEKLDASGRESVEISLRGCRAHLELDDVGGARARLDQAVEMLADEARVDWRIAWHKGLLELVEGDVEAARTTFDEVYRALPGEAAPKLALGFCAEHLGEPHRAEPYYEAVWKQDRSQVSAAFGLARVRLAAAGRAAAVTALDEVSDQFRHSLNARIAAVRVLCGRLRTDGAHREGAHGDGLPGAADLTSAVERLSDRPLAGAGLDRDARARLTATVREVALDVRRARPGEELPSGEVLGAPPTERRLREGLAESLGSLAEQARDAREHGVVMDLANSVRPWTWW